MITENGFIVVPEEARKFVGEPLPGTRCFKMEAPMDEYPIWIRAVFDLCGEPCTSSPGGVAGWVGVSRAAVHKRIREGKMTAFFFYPTFINKRLFGREKVERESPYIHIPMVEVEAWREEVEQRALRDGQLSEEEIEGRKPDLRGDFYLWHSKWMKQKRKEGERDRE